MLPLHKMCGSDSCTSGISFFPLLDGNHRFASSHSRRQKMARRRRLLLILPLAFMVTVTRMSYHRQTPHRRNPFQTPRRRLEEPTNNIRLLSLGGASTWGVGLANPEPVHKEGITGLYTHEAAYPYRLAPDVRNAAQRVGGPTLAALCSQSIVEDGIYDVITIEFSNAYQESDLMALNLLAQRLRTRFPKAVLVFVQLWSPSFYYYLDDTTSVDFATWRRLNDWSWDSLDWQGALQEKEWKYSATVTAATARLQDIVNQINGHFVHLAPPQDPIHGLATASTWFTEIAEEDTGRFEYTLSSKGHMVVANHIRSIVDQANVLRYSLSERNLLGDWGSGDQCQIWYDYDPSGEQSSSMIPVYSSTVSLQRFGNDKYALEISEKGGSIVVTNTYDEDRMLYLTYMTTCISSHKMYPKAQVQLFQDGQPLKKGKGVVVDPYHHDNVDSRHVTRTTAIGKIPSHSSIEIRIQPLESTLAPFRLVGASFLAKEKVQWNIATDFELEPERVRI